MKTYVLTVSRYFPATHPRKGERTKFADSIYFGNKIHTIRANYDLWKKRIDEVNTGEAVLSIRYWTGKPYASKQEEFATLGKGGGLGVQIADLSNINDHAVLIGKSVPPNTPIVDVYKRPYCSDFVAKNDGLSFDDFEAWFKGYDLSKPMVIILFTDFRY